MIETVENRTEQVNGQENSIVIRRRSGIHSYRTESGVEILVDATTITDAGRLGVSHCISTHREFSQEERKAGKQAIQDTLGTIMEEQGFW